MNGQTAVSSVNTTYNSATTGLTYSTTGAVGSPLVGNTYTYNFGNLSGTTNNNRQLNNFISGGSTYSFVTLAGQYVKIRRVNNAVVTGIRSLRYSEGLITGSIVNIVNDYNDDMESFFNGNTNFNSGSDNLFANQGDGNGNNNNIERLDVIFPSGVSATDNTRFGFSVFERGAQGAHDPIKVAVILAVDGAGNPTSYSTVISLTSASYGAADPVAAADYVISRRENATEPNLKVSTTTNQQVAGVFVKISDFAIANNTTIYGYSIIPNDFTGSTSADIIAYNNATLYPTNTSSATGSGGIDLVSATGVFQSGSVVSRTISGNIYNDVNGLTNSLVDGTGTNASGLNAILVNNTTGNVVNTIAVAADGTYTFGSVANGTYTVRISLTGGTIGSAPPAVLMPSGWVNTGEGTTAAGDGTVNGITNTFVFSGGTLTNVNFGVEQTPTPSTIVGANQVNPGGTTAVTVPAATFGATDPSSGTIGSIRISAFPTNTTTITINGISYTSGTFPGGGVSVPTNTSGQPTQAITLDPIDGTITSVITYYATDNAGKESSTTGTASMPFTTVTVSGNVYNDVNGLTNLLVDGTGTNAGGVNAILVDNATGNVAATIAVAAGGTYTFPSVNGGTYTVRISTTAGTVGSAPPAVSLPAGWVNTGEGTTAAGDGTVNGITNTFVVANANITNVNFGIEQPATAGSLSAASQVNPGGTTAVTVPAATFSGTDFSSGTITNLLISAFPSNTTTITINGTSYTSGTFPGGGVSVPTNAAGQPTQAITIDPINGAVTVVIPYYVTDNAGKQSATTGTASMPFGTLNVSGNVYNDVNGLTNSLVDGTGTNAGGVNAILVDGGGLVVATAAVAAGGTYTLSGVNGGTYSFILTTNTGTIGVAAPAIALPSGWVNTGEGTTTAGDGTVNGQTNTFVVSSANITNINFGIEERPTTIGSTSTASQLNPGGLNKVTAPASKFGGADVSSGTVSSIRITAFPTNTTTITINGTSYSSATFPGGGVIIPTNALGQPSQLIEIDPVNGGVTARIGYVTIDNAGIESLGGTDVSLPFSSIDISGNVFNDVNGLSDNTVGGTGTNGGTLNALLVDISTGFVAATATVSAGGAYSFTNQNSGNYDVIITTNTGVIGSTPPAIALPSGYVSTGENLGAGTGSDGTVNSTLSLGSISTNITDANFGIEQRPTAGGGANTGVNQVGLVQIPFPANTFTNITLSSDPAPGGVTAIRITAFPVGIATIVINGTSYTSGTFPGGGVIVTADASGNPTQTITIDPVANGVTSVTILFVTRDAAGVESNNTGTAVLTLNDDIDDDNDGITDINESGGYDPFADCDNDGIPNYADPTPVCTIPSGNDPWGRPYQALTWSDVNNDGINDFFDWDRDGIMNELDLDSDNDGITDAQEARPNSTTFAFISNGQITGTDADNNGLLSSADNANANPVLNGLQAQDLDRDGIPNFLDLDSDGDGITDRTEALGTYSSTGVSAGPDVDGDGVRDENFGSNAASTADNINGMGAKGLILIDSDGDGKPDAYDIDSDNDGITDNVESQPTCSMELPLGTDCNGNGVDDAYDITSCIAFTRTSAGVTPYDHDSDGIPDYLDLDTDNDGSPDVNEGSGQPGNFVTDFTDVDGDGLIGQFDNFNIQTAITNFTNNVGHNQMGNNGDFDGPVPTGSMSFILKSLPGLCAANDRDWRNISILPLHILDFTGLLRADHALLQWHAVNEQEVSRYVVERSIDAVHYNPIGNRTLANSKYNYDDETGSLNAAVIYYRIKQENKNGTVFYTNVVALNKVETTSAGLKIYPNPADTYVTLYFNSNESQTGLVNIYSMAGKQLMSLSEAVKKGRNTLTIHNLEKLLHGNYVVQVITRSETMTGRLVK